MISKHVYNFLPGKAAGNTLQLLSCRIGTAGAGIRTCGDVFKHSTHWDKV